ncbi:MAG: TIGR00266 family protein [Fimbriimonadaceae bacterium]|nr:TIGR00266 family protein [Fimbriimonadaceae bacterium]
MQVELLHQPASTIAKVTLRHGESVRAESGAMIAMTPTIEVKSKLEGGIGKALGRFLAKESLFQSTFTASLGPGEVLLAPAGPGDVVAVEPRDGLMVTSGCYLAGDPGIKFETITSVKNFFSGEGIFLMRASGDGKILLSSYGAIHPVQLQPGQQYLVDTGHLVAFSASLGYRLRKVARGLLNTIKSGEGIVVELTGPGIAYLQTRTPHPFGVATGGND